ncbi:MAG: hypothetical protein M3437_10165 [Chloroflexota bacterium]|nr:hypothetical protein [Chloroflexota bacterium]MDQ5864751.1 hypothetical protein [Chloroflexota bacterium]
MEAQNPSPIVGRPLSDDQRGLKHSPIKVALVALLGYLFIVAAFLYESGDPRDLVLIGRTYIERSNVSPTITVDPNYPYLEHVDGYDGQFAYFIALDPANARYYVDNDSYRYMRILYPVLARTLALGKPEWIAWAMIFVNLGAVTLGTWAVAAWCKSRQLPPWLALVYAFYVGQVIAVTRSLNEPLAFALVATAIYIFDRYKRYRWVAAIVFGLAGLARETTLVFPAIYTLLLARQRDLPAGERLRTSGQLMVLALGPSVVWQIIIWMWLGSFGFTRGPGIMAVPFESLGWLYTFDRRTLDTIQSVLLPALIAVGATILIVWRKRTLIAQPKIWMLLVNAFFFVILLPPAAFWEIYASARIAMPVVMASTYLLAWSNQRTWFYICAGMWLAYSATYILNPAYNMLDRLLWGLLTVADR